MVTFEDGHGLWKSQAVQGTDNRFSAIFFLQATKVVEPGDFLRQFLDVVGIRFFFLGLSNRWLVHCSLGFDARDRVVQAQASQRALRTKRVQRGSDLCKINLCLRSAALVQ